MSRAELLAAVKREHYGEARRERYGNIAVIMRERHIQPPPIEATPAERSSALVISMLLRVPVLTKVEFRNNPAKAPWLSNRNWFEAESWEAA